MKPTAKRRKRMLHDTASKTRQNVPYDTGKVKIGLLYQPPPPPVDADAEKIQAALMKWPLSLERRIADWVNRSPWSLVGAALVIIVLMTFMKGCTK